MSELVNVLSLSAPDIIVPMERKEFYKEQSYVFQETWKPTEAVEVVNIFLFNLSWQLILQKRSSIKAHNPDLIDKTIGWHINYGNSPHFTVILETMQELQIPSIILDNNEDFTKTYDLLKNYTATAAIMKHFWTEIVSIPKTIDGKLVSIANKTYLYIWVYAGSVNNIDREVKGVLFYSLEELAQELKKFPNIFTNDLRYFFNKFQDYFEEFKEEFNLKK